MPTQDFLTSSYNGVTTVFNMGLADGGARSTTCLAGRRGGRAFERPTLPGQRAAAGERQPEVLLRTCSRRCKTPPSSATTPSKIHGDPPADLYDALITGAGPGASGCAVMPSTSCPGPDAQDGLHRAHRGAALYVARCAVCRGRPLRAGGRRQHRPLLTAHTNLTRLQDASYRACVVQAVVRQAWSGTHIGHLHDAAHLPGRPAVQRPGQRPATELPARQRAP